MSSDEMYLRGFSLSVSVSKLLESKHFMAFTPSTHEKKQQSRIYNQELTKDFMESYTPSLSDHVHSFWLPKKGAFKK